MKRVIFLIVLGLFLISCGMGKPITIVIPSGATPVPIPTPPPANLSPINAGDAGQIQMVYAIHVNVDAQADELLAISPDKKWVAQTVKDGAPLHVQRLMWTTNGSFVPMGNGFTTFFFIQNDIPRI